MRCFLFEEGNVLERNEKSYTVVIL